MTRRDALRETDHHTEAVKEAVGASKDAGDQAVEAPKHSNRAEHRKRNLSDVSFGATPGYGNGGW
jgi:hypothetical protein